MKVSVIACTYNRSDLLAELLESLVKQDLDAPYEILLVDNNSSDNTREVAASLIRSCRIPVKYIFEEQQGLSVARNRGIQEACGEIVAFLDDDSVADTHWLSALVSGYDDDNVACVGGKLELLWHACRPEWLTPSLEAPLGKLSYGDAVQDLKFPRTPFGGNISFRKAIFENLATFSPALGRGATGLLSNEELELCERIDRAGYLVRYIPAAVVLHRVFPYRLTKMWFQHRYYWQGRSEAILDESIDARIYGQLRQHAATMVAHAVEPSMNEFERECYAKVTKGYLHYLIFNKTDNVTAGHFRRMRALETLLSGLRTEMKLFAGSKYEQIRLKDEAIRHKDEEIQHKNEEICQKNEIIIQNKQYIDDILNSWSWKITKPMRLLLQWIKHEK